MAIVQTPDERHFVQVTHPRAQAVPNSTGTATLAAGDVVRHISASLNPIDNIIRSAGKTGSRGLLAALKGRKGATFSNSYPLAGSGTAGTASDLDAVLEGIFGAAGTDSAGVSVTYALANAIPGMTFWNFRDPAGTNIFNEVLWGGVIETAEFAFGAEAEATVTIGGSGAYVINKPNFSSLSTASKGGLTSFPSEPGSLAYLGTPAVAFVGSATINGVSTFKLSEARIRVSLNRQTRASFGSYFPDTAAAGVREISVDFSVYEEDTSDQAALRHLAFTKGVFDMTLVLGEDAGNIWTFGLNNVTIPSVERQDGGLESILSMNGCVASKTSISANDELSLVCT
jgi:hypothetical protein